MYLERSGVPFHVRLSQSEYKSQMLGELDGARHMFVLVDELEKTKVISSPRVHHHTDHYLCSRLIERLDPLEDQVIEVQDLVCKIHKWKLKIASVTTHILNPLNYKAHKLSQEARKFSFANGPIDFFEEELSKSFPYLFREMDEETRKKLTRLEYGRLDKELKKKGRKRLVSKEGDSSWVRDIPIECKDDTIASSRSGLSPRIEDVSGTAYQHVRQTRETVIVDKDIKTEGFPNQQISVMPDATGPSVQQMESHAEDSDIERAVSLSLKMAEQEKALREENSVPCITDVHEQGNTPSNRRQGIGPFNEGALKQPKLETGSSSVPDDEDEDIDEQPLVRQRSRRVSFGSDSAKAPSAMDESPPLSSGRHNIGSQPQSNGSAFPSEWGGISSEEHNEAVMLEAAHFGGIPETTAYRFGYPTQERNQTDLDRDFYPRPPSPTLEAQRLPKEQQDDEYLASLQADREKELEAIEEAETRQLSEQAAKDAALEEERQKEETILEQSDSGSIMKIQ